MTAARPKYLLVLAFAAGAILAIGSVLRPAPEAGRGPEPTPSDLERLAQLSQRRAVEDSARFFTSIAARADTSLVRVASTGMTGVVWGPGLIVTANPGTPVPAGVMVDAADGVHSGRTSAGGPRLPIVAIQAGPLPNLPVPRGAAASLEPGAWAIAVWRRGHNRAFTSGHLVGERERSSEFLQWQEVSSTIALTSEMQGGGLFDLDGRLLGIILPTPGGPSAVAAASIDAMLIEANTLEEQLLALVGMRVAALTPEESEHLRAPAGVLVRSVWDGYPADTSGLSPGDVIVSINGAPMAAPGDLSVLTSAERPSPLVLGVAWRGAARDVTLWSQPGGEGSEGEVPAGGLGWEAPPNGFRIATVAPGSRADRAGIRAGDWLLRIDRVEPRSLEQVERTLAAQPGTPHFLELRRGDRRWGTLF